MQCPKCTHRIVESVWLVGLWRCKAKYNAHTFHQSALEDLDVIE